MTLKSYIKSALFAAIGSATLAACNDIDADDRFEQLPQVDAKRTVLLEEFTGQNCPNCPVAHEVIEQLLGQYPDNLIVVSIHAGFQSIHVDDGGLATDEGEYYAEQLKVDKFPTGVVDGIGAPVTSDKWAADIRTALATPSHVELTVKATADDDDNLVITTDITSFMTDPGARLQLWIVENDIRGLQMLPDGSLKIAYRHNHVFRTAANGLDGQPVALANDGAPLTLDCTFPISEEWDVDNLSVVAFLRGSDGTVLQAAQSAVNQ